MISPNIPSGESDDLITQAASLWTLRHDRGLTAEEQDAFSHWLAADPRHRTAWAVHRWGWDELDRLIGLQTTVDALPDPDLLAPRRRTRPAQILRFTALVLAAAAAITVALIVFRPSRSNVGLVPSTATLATPIEQRTLDDGSVVTLNRGAEIAVTYTPYERRVQLVRGEANFQVEKDRARPFIVTAGGLDVRAVGTNFNVRLGSSDVEVLVTEGKVQIISENKADSPGFNSQAAEVYLTANQRTLVPLAPVGDTPRVATLTNAELATRLAWQPRLLDFTDAPLPDIVAEFNRRNPVRLTLGDATLSEVRLSATFRSDNLEGFVRLMESDFDMRADRREGEIVLRKLK